jgi:hypothetical protein
VRWKDLRDLTRAVKGLWMLTGTPAAQSPVDAYGLAKLVNPSGVPMFFGQFRDKVMNKVSMYRWVPVQPWDRTWTDPDLYEKYGIVQDEIAFIESMIRPMEGSDD